MKTKSAHNHNGHRIRLRNLIDNVGLKNLNDMTSKKVEADMDKLA